MKATDNKTHDSQCKVEALGSSVKEVIADAGVDSHEIFRQLASREIEPVTKVRRDVVIRGNKARNDVVREIKSGGKREMVWRVSFRRLSGGLVSMRVV